MQNKRWQYIQNRQHWCWAVSCKITGERFKKLNQEWGFDIIMPCGNVTGAVSRQEYENGVITKDYDGINWAIQSEKEVVRVDAWQRAIVMNANSRETGYEGDIPGDDEAKRRGIKFYLTGDTDSRTIDVETYGSYDVPLGKEERRILQETLNTGAYVIGNMVFEKKEIFHSVVILAEEDGYILFYDPCSGETVCGTQEEVFGKGTDTGMGHGVLRWIQKIAHKG